MTVTAFMFVLSLGACGKSSVTAEIEDGLDELMAGTPFLSDLDWDEINKLGVPLAAKEGIWKTCYGSSQGEFRAFLYDLESVDIDAALIEDMRSSGEYVMANSSCDQAFIEPALAAASLAQKAWNEKLRIERLKQSGEH